MSVPFTLRNLVIAALLLVLALLPAYVALTGDRFMLTLFAIATRLPYTGLCK